MTDRELVGLGAMLGGTDSALCVPEQRNHPLSLMKESSKDILRILLSIVFPPVGVFLQVGFGFHFWINLLLTLLFYVPGLVHGIYIILSHGSNRTAM